MMAREYYSTRKGIVQRQYDLPTLKKVFQSIYRELLDKDYFHEAFGYFCVDAGDVPGTVGDVDAFTLRRLRKE